LYSPSDWCLLVGPPEAGEQDFSGGPSIVYLAENVAVDMASRVIWVWKDTSIAEDRIAVEFAEVLEGLGVKYAIVADYVAILLGRSRRSEDVDFIVEPISEDAFLELASRLRARLRVHGEEPESYRSPPRRVRGQGSIRGQEDPRARGDPQKGAPLTL